MAPCQLCLSEQLWPGLLLIGLAPVALASVVPLHTEKEKSWLWLLFLHVLKAVLGNPWLRKLLLVRRCQTAPVLDVMSLLMENVKHTKLGKHRIGTHAPATLRQ
jgi:hypothetical protein